MSCRCSRPISEDEDFEDFHVEIIITMIMFMMAMVTKATLTSQRCRAGALAPFLRNMRKYEDYNVHGGDDGKGNKTTSA